MKIDLDKINVIHINDKNIDEYLKLVIIVKNNMSNPEWLGDFSREDYNKILNNGGEIIGFIYNENLIAAGVLIPSTQKDLEKFLSKDLDYKKTIDFGPQMVHPDYIGNGIQGLIIDTLDLISRHKKYEYALSTVHPDNIFSINNLLKKSFVYVGRVELKRGPRNVYRKKIM